MTRIWDPRERELEVLTRLTSFRGMDVLDVGCGQGRTARRIARGAASVLGLDPDEEKITLARKAEPEEGSDRLEFLAADVVVHDFPPGSFDAVVFTRSL